MSFLPFVLTFLLLLTLTSSFIFSSTTKTARESHIILSQHRVYLKLLSKQQHTFYKKMVPTPKPIPNPQKQRKSSEKEAINPRTIGDGCEESKLNLFHLIHGNNPEVQHILKQTTIRLIEILYGSCDFYKSSPLKDIAHTIVQHMMNSKIQSLEELRFEDENINQIYYRMLQGTNTGYPPLTEYMCLSEKQYSIYFRYTSEQVIRAALGEALASTLFDLERAQREKNKRLTVLSKEPFQDLVQHNPSSSVPLTLIENIFTFGNTKKGTCQTRQEGKIRAHHKSDLKTSAEG